MRRPAKKNEKCCAGFGSQLCQTAIKNTPQQEIHCGVSLSICAMPIKAIPHNSKCRYGERGAADAKPKAQIILDAAKVSAASGGNSEPKQGQRSQSARGFCPRSTMRVPQPDIIEHFGNADAVPQPPKRCLSRKAGIVRCCPRFSAKCPCLHGKILIRWESRKKQKNGLFLQRGGLFEFPVSPKWMYNRKESL